MQKVQECIPYIFSSAKNVNKKLILAGCERNDGQTNLAERNVKEIGGGGRGTLGLSRDGVCPKTALKTRLGDWGGQRVNTGWDLSQNCLKDGTWR